ncbi:DUF2577 family protein [Megasphaera vaginalis (ex Srinivasan et al. 2021)]|uniref:DUF2577 family protein n=1 Tax=Megasphaera vaginalis (ex Srinivasan et al. 2021) TaxID=1111454 RepID=UPI00055DDDF3|nr:DUF2577 family protein [Megasphaera vaginalis (ex Srinivasan et al. 2021)]
MSDNKHIPAASQSAMKIVHMMHGIAQDARPRQTMIGLVVSPPPNILVKVNDILLDAADVYVANYLLPNYTRHVVGETDFKSGGSGYAQYDNHNHPVNNDETWTDTLKVGDLVEVVPVYDPTKQDQMYIIGNQVTKL